MKKRLLIIFIALAVLVLIVVLGSTVFTVKQSEIVLYNELGVPIASSVVIDSDNLVENYFGKSIFFLNEEEVIDEIHTKEAFREYFCISITREFPNTLMLNIALRQPIFFLSYSGTGYLLDNQGYCIAAEENDDGYINITNFSSWVSNIQVGSYVEWNSAYGDKFSVLCDVVNTVWRFEYNFSDIHQFVSGFDYDDSELTIYTNNGQGAVIIIEEAADGLADKLIKAVSVYNSDKVDNTSNKNTINVDEKGRVTTYTND